MRCQCSTPAVHTTARGRRARGNSARLAAFSPISPRRTAALRAARNVARIRPSVTADTGSPSAWRSRMTAANIASTCAADNSASRTCPRHGPRYKRTWAS